jgi:uncharacterized protein YfaS (alpha-2-macroglobulin family)
MKKLFSFILFTSMLFSALWVMTQCKKGPRLPDEMNPAFTEKIVAFTSGVISAESTIQLLLAEDNAHAGEPNSAADNDLFRIKPAIKGHAIWVDKRTLEFRPDEKLKSGQVYTVRFKLGKVIKTEKSLAVFKFGFSVVEQNWSVKVEGYQTHNENDLVWNKITGSVNTADYTDCDEIKKYFVARQQNRKLTINWLPGEDRRNFSFSVDSVQRTEEPGKATISWDAAPDFPGIKGSQDMEIPSLADYKVMDVTVVHDPEQYIRITFDGLIYLSNDVSMQYTVSGNIISAYPESQLNGSTVLIVSEGLVNILDYKLKEAFTAEITFEVPKPAVRLVGKGVILPSSKGMFFPFEAVNLNAVDVKIIKIYENNIGHFLQVNRLDGSNQLKRAGKLVHKETITLNHAPADLGKWNRFSIDLSKLIEPDPGAMYRVEISFRKRYSLYPCGEENASEGNEDEAMEEREEEYETSYWDNYEDYYDDYYYYDDYGYDYEWDERDNPCSASYYSQQRNVARNILASDLGLTAKIGTDQSVFCAVTSLATAKPIQGVEVIAYNYQLQQVGSGSTDNNGFVSVSLAEKPYLLIARYEKQRGYLKLDEGSSLSLAAFDVTGNAVSKGIKAFIYGERGVWRPGDTLFLSCIIEDKQKRLPASHPVTFELVNPKGQLYARTTKTSGVNGFYTWQVPTSSDVITGNWNLRVKIGGTPFNKAIKIESVKPNRLKINLDFKAEKLYAGGSNQADLSVTWLHGAVASGLKTSISVVFTKAPTLFEKYATYQFTDPSKQFSAEEQVIFDQSVNEAGLAKVIPSFSIGNSAPGMLMANFTTRVFEKSGDFSFDRLSIPYSPYSAYVGIRTPEGDKRGMLLTDTTQWVDVVLLNEKGSLVSRKNLQAYVYKLDWRYWWESSGDEIADFTGNTYNEPVVSKILSTVNGKGRFSFRINRPDWGRFFIRVVDSESGHSAGKIIYIDWPGWAGRPMRDNPEAASMLTFNADKEKYWVGETAEIAIPTSGSGNALLTIESGSRILSKEWLPVNGKEIRHRVTITPEMAPNVYVHVSLIQPHANTENDMPMRLYGVIPFFVEDAQTRLTPMINMPTVLEPLQQYTIQVSEKNKKDMTYTLAVVEEGLLDLTRFKTPDPWENFYAREALGVKTWDLYDMVIGVFGGKLASILGIGGDEELKDDGSSEKANRFKPVVQYLGPFTLKAGKTNAHKIQMPNYIGSVRVMVVAGNEGAYGKAEKAVPVKKPLMVLATLPRVLGPEESVQLPVTVFAMDNKVKQVTITVKTNEMLQLEDSHTRTINFTQPGDKVVSFNLKVASATGIGRVLVTATGGGKTATYDIELNVRTSNPPVITSEGIALEQGKTGTLTYALPGMENTNNAILEVSGIPPIDAERRLRYLIAYPHGCIEQTTSAVFPQLFIEDIMEIDKPTRAQIDANIKAGIRKLQGFQLSGGAFSYWPGNNEPNSWGTSYAGHFLLEAEKKGYAVPAVMKSSWVKAQRQIARQWSNRQVQDPYYQYDLEQAYRLYTLALAGHPEMSAMNRLREIQNISLQAKWKLAAAYALSGQITVAKELIAREKTEIEPYSTLSSSYGSVERDWAMILETLILLNENAKGLLYLRKIADALSSPEWMSTQSSAYCMMAIAGFTKGRHAGKVSFAYKTNEGQNMLVETGKPISKITIPLARNAKEGSITVSNKTNGLLYARLIMEGIPRAGEEMTFSNNLSVGINFVNLKGQPIEVSRITQGSDFIAVVSVNNTSHIFLRDLALTQIFPAGWEIRNSRMDNIEVPEGKSIPTYQDIRDDRVYTYFDLYQGQTKTFTVQLNASYLGRYYLSGPYCEAMYDNHFSAQLKGEWVEVIAAGE